MTTSEFFMSAWDWKPSVVLGCTALTALYVWATGCRFTRKGAAWVTGVLLLLLLLVSPLDELADRYLFSVHMAKHILLVLVVPALLLMGLPAGQRFLSYRPVKLAEKIVGTPAIGWVSGIGAMALWHIPVLFNAALAHEALHIAEHLSLLMAGTTFWWPILSPLPGSRLKPVPQAAAYLFTSCLVCTSLGVLITFAPNILYPAYLHRVDLYGMLPTIRERWGISAAMDQQIGGLLMWVPACFVYLTAIMAMFARWYREESERPAESREPQWT
jgi:putative membrane protein